MLIWAVAWIYVVLVRHPAVRELPEGYWLLAAIIADATWLSRSTGHGQGFKR